MHDLAFSKLPLLFLLSLLVFSVACPPRIVVGYEVKDGKVVYSEGMKGPGATKQLPVSGADPLTFEILDNEYGQGWQARVL